MQSKIWNNLSNFARKFKKYIIFIIADKIKLFLAHKLFEMKQLLPYCINIAIVKFADF